MSQASIPSVNEVLRAAREAAYQSFTPEQRGQAREVVRSNRATMKSQMSKGGAESLGDGVLGSFLVASVLEAKQTRQGPTQKM